MKPMQSRKPTAAPISQSLMASPPRGMRQSFTRAQWFRSFAARVFRTCQKLGVNITPHHFYWPIPDLNTLAKKDWAASSMPEGVDLQLERQVRMLESDFLEFQQECDFSECETGCKHEFHFNNGFFERVDAEIAYCMVRFFKPGRIVEVGGGKSTRLLATALRRNREEGLPGQLICIEPHPEPVLKRGLPGLSELIPRRVQQVPLEVFDRLEPGDILFIDSSHVVAIDSDVVQEHLRIFPRLKPGVVVHLHDIFMPADYPEKFVMTNLCFWGEQYVLEAFLSYNRAFEVLWSSSAMQLFHRQELERHFPAWMGSFQRMPAAMQTFTPTSDGRNVWPCSFWMQRTT